MRCSECLYDNRPGTTYCEHCGSPLPVEVPLFLTCQECGFLNPPDEKYCERCGIELETTLQLTPDQVRRKKAKKRRKAKTERKGFPLFTTLFVVLIALIIIGAIPINNQITPVLQYESSTLLTVLGVPDDDSVFVAAQGGFSAAARDTGGILRMELYSDGQLVASKDYDGSSTFVTFTPDLDSLAQGQHDVFIRSTNTNGDTALSAIFPVLSSGVSGVPGVTLASATHENLEPPTGLTARVSDKGGRIVVSWEPPGESVNAIRVYSRPPFSAGLVPLGDIDGSISSFEFPFNSVGLWEVYVSYLDTAGQEGPLGYATLFILESGIAGKAPEAHQLTGDMHLPEPEKLHMAASLADCQFVASEMGVVRDVLFRSCQSMVSGGDRQFLLWNWPAKVNPKKRFTENDLTGYELKLVLTNQNGQTLGESITALPFAEARGMARSSYDVDCGVEQTWYLRAVGPSGTSDWIYAGSIPREPCGQASPPVDGCSGQMDYQTNWGPFGQFVPDKAFASACDMHDLCYDQASSGKNKVTCDNEFLADMLDICAESIAMIDRQTCSDIATGYYDSVNLYGRYTYDGSINVMDCLNAIEPRNCFTGSSSDVAFNIFDRMKIGVFWTGEAIESGAERIWHGAMWLTGEVWRGIDNVIH